MSKTSVGQSTDLRKRDKGMLLSKGISPDSSPSLSATWQMSWSLASNF